VSDWRDIGSGHEIEYYVGEDETTRIGIIDRHNRPDGTPCAERRGGAILFDIPQNADVPGRALWQVVNLEPLTLSPSLLCQLCGDHGFIRDGRWVAA
jgi:hypothetical protein